MLALLVEAVGLREYGELWANLLRESRRYLTTRYLATQLMASDDAETGVKSLCGFVDEIAHLDYFRGVYEELALAALPGQLDLLREFQAKIAEVEAYEIRTEATDDDGQEYPFTQERRREQLAAALKDLGSDEEGRQVRQAFERRWRREKAEYDQSVRRKGKAGKELIVPSISRSRKRKH